MKKLYNKIYKKLIEKEIIMNQTSAKEFSVLSKQIGGSHYKDLTYQPSEFINGNRLLFAEGNAIKYICRHSRKGGKEDLEKAKHYIDMIIERDYLDQPKQSWIDGYKKWKK